jgi:selenide,water dikinase
MITNAAAKPGDWMVLTKPLGTGIVTTAIKRELCPPALARKAVGVMKQLNTVGAELAERGLVRAGTDVTGFGLLGHLGAMCRASGVGAEVYADRVPPIGKRVWDLIRAGCIPGGTKGNWATAQEMCEADGVDEVHKMFLADAQTSGGLLLCVASRHLDRVLLLLAKHRTCCAAVIGRMVASAKPKILLIARAG